MRQIAWPWGIWCVCAIYQPASGQVTSPQSASAVQHAFSRMERLPPAAHAACVAPIASGDDETDEPSHPPLTLPGTSNDFERRLDEMQRQLSAATEQLEQLRQTETLDSPPPGFEVDYDGGFVIRPQEANDSPFELKINGRLQLRYTGFKRNVDVFTDQSGMVFPVRSRNDFEVERGRLEFRAVTFDPRLHWYLNIDFDTDDNHRLVAHDTWVNYEFSDLIDLHVGKSKVPGSRAWLNSSSRTRFADRSMATTFFRPDRTIGIWTKGKLASRLWYEMLVGNGFKTTDLEPEDLDQTFVYSGSMWWQPLSEFGRGFSDLEYHVAPALQLGHSFTYGDEQAVDGASTLEDTTFRLSDGTKLVAPGALAPGIAVEAFQVYLYTVDLALKYRGFSFSTEWYFRWLEGIRGDGPLPLGSLMDHGFYVDAGIFLIPKCLELNSRVSQVDGLFGDAWEYSGGVNWYISGTHRNKLTLDLTALRQNPASSSSPGLIPGMDGTLVRAQWQVAF